MSLLILILILIMNDPFFLTCFDPVSCAESAFSFFLKKKMRSCVYTSDLVIYLVD